MSLQNSDIETVIDLSLEGGVTTWAKVSQSFFHAFFQISVSLSCAYGDEASSSQLCLLRDLTSVV